MSRFSSFAVAGGSGMVGRAIVDGLLNANAGRVIVLSRSAETKVPAGAEVKAVDFDSQEDVEKAIAGVDVVVCTLRDSQSTQEPILAHACKAAGTKLFVPSEFGNDLTGLGGGILYQKIKIAEEVKKLGLPNLKVFCGAWHQTTFNANRFGYDFPNGKVEVVGTGEEPWSFTSVVDVGSWLGSLLVSHPAEELVKLGSVSIEGDRKTQNEVLALWEETHPGQKLEVIRASLADSQAFVSQCEGFQWFTRSLVNLWVADGPGQADSTKRGSVKLANELVPGWKPQSVRDYLAAFAETEVTPGWKFYEA